MDVIMGPDPRPDCPTLGMHIWGWMSNIELEWLGAQAAKMDSVVEVGSLHGRSAFMLLSSCPGPVTCIDPWNDAHDASYPSFMGSCGHFPNLRAVRGFSPAVIYTEDLPDADMVFLDGAHDYDSVLADVTHWLPKTRKLICGHDYQNIDGGYPDVKTVVDAEFGERVRVAPGTALWYVELS
jgi:Methyltransferase domain